MAFRVETAPRGAVITADRRTTSGLVRTAAVPTTIASAARSTARAASPVVGRRRVISAEGYGCLGQKGGRHCGQAALDRPARDPEGVGQLRGGHAEDASGVDELGVGDARGRRLAQRRGELGEVVHPLRTEAIGQSGQLAAPLLVGQHPPSHPAPQGAEQIRARIGTALSRPVAEELGRLREPIGEEGAGVVGDPLAEPELPRDRDDSRDERLQEAAPHHRIAGVLEQDLEDPRSLELAQSAHRLQGEDEVPEVPDPGRDFLGSCSEKGVEGAPRCRGPAEAGPFGSKLGEHV